VFPCLHPSPLDLPAYRDGVLERFGNAALADSNQRVVADSYAKLREFVVPTIRETLARHAPIAAVAMLPALFLAFLEKWQRNELDFLHQDASLDAHKAQGICVAADPVAALVADAALWGELADDARLIEAVGIAHARLVGHGALRE
jgi:D-arabinitol 4-dehydrogenase